MNPGDPMSDIPFSPGILQSIFSRFDPTHGTIEGGRRSVRRLSDLRGIFADERAYELALEAGDPIVYTVESIEGGEGDGDLHYGIGVIMPGRVGCEYYMTKGHLHAWRPAAEVYVGLSGKGAMLLEDEAGGTRLLPLERNSIVYVPGHTAHRTINTGEEPLAYLGVFPARAGHEYGREFTEVVIHGESGARMVSRKEMKRDEEEGSTKGEEE
jgi:glucose-6-phosphate isomerase